jgi:hypothetical protein
MSYSTGGLQQAPLGRGAPAVQQLRATTDDRAAGAA